MHRIKFQKIIQYEFRREKNILSLNISLKDIFSTAWKILNIVSFLKLRNYFEKKNRVKQEWKAKKNLYINLKMFFSEQCPSFGVSFFLFTGPVNWFDHGNATHISGLGQEEPDGAHSSPGLQLVWI